MTTSHRIKTAALIGAIAPVLSLGGTLILTALSPWFDWTSNAISDLGNSTLGLAFNATLIVGGLCYLYFILSIFRDLSPTKFIIPGLILISISAGMSIGIGVFPSGTYGPIHNLFAVGFFTIGGFATIIEGTGWWIEQRNHAFCGYSFLLVSIGLAAWVLSPFPGIAIPELVSSLLYGIWQLWFAVIIYQQYSLPTKK